jgi:hypothetical protein
MIDRSYLDSLIHSLRVYKLLKKNKVNGPVTKRKDAPLVREGMRKGHLSFQIEEEIINLYFSFITYVYEVISFTGV